MEEKLELLLSKINLEKNEEKYFENGKLEKIICKKRNNEYTFVIHLEKPLSIFLYKKTKEEIKKSFNIDGTLNLKINAKTFDEEILNEYYKYEFERVSNFSPIIKTILENSFDLKEDVLIIKVDNKAELLKLEGIKEKVQNNLNNEGFNIKIKIELSEEKISLEPVKEKVIKKPKKESPIILGGEIKTKISSISDLTFEMDNVAVEAQIFGKDVFESSRSDFKIITLKLTDFHDSIYCKIFTRDKAELTKLDKRLKEGNFYKIKGYTKNDKYSNEIVLNAREINISDKKIETIMDDAEEKRVELHTHTKMSQMDGICDAKTLIKQAFKWGHKAIAITDHNGAQSFPDVFHTINDINKNLPKENHFKAIYGTELNLIEDDVDIVIRGTDDDLLESTFVVFDLETTGFNAGGADSIIEIGAVKVKNGEIIERFDELINPNRKLPAKIIEITNITDADLEDKDTEENAVKRFKQWFGDLPLVAHNAKFDISFLSMAYEKYNLGEITNTVIDTLELSRTLDSGFARHGLSALVKRYNVPWDETAHHRADYDAEGTGLVLCKMIEKLRDQNFKTINDITKLVSKEEIHKFGKSYHINLLATNKVGLKNLFKIISLANTKYLYKTPRILRSEIANLREGLLIGSGCYLSEIFTLARSKSDEELSKLINFYDYVEVQPLEVYDHLLQTGDFGNKAELIENIKKVIRVTKEAGKLVVATGDVHHITKEDKIYRKIIVNQKVPGGGRHPLARKNITDIPDQYLRTTNEMLECFNFLDDDLAKEIVITNPNKIADKVEEIEVIIDTGGIPFSPKIDKSVETVTNMVYEKASSWYGNPLPVHIEERIAEELYGMAPLEALNKMKIEDKHNYLHNVILKGYDAVRDLVKDAFKDELTEEEAYKIADKKLTAIIGGGFDVIYLIAQKLVKKSNDDGFLVGSRGSVGSSFVATMMGITEVNPLSAHYRCPNCKKSIFEENNISLGSLYSSGFDLPDKDCPECKIPMIKDGQDMPFATFLGFNADKVPDIDLNFSDLNQAATHEYTKVLFGVDNVYRAGTIGTVADKTAYGYVKGYCEDTGINMRSAEIERLAKGCTGVKRTTGQHPGGIVVIPGYMDVFDFTPFQFPADDPNSAWRTTHFDYHAIDQDVLKLDILGHTDPTQLRMIKDITGDDVTKVPLDDKETMNIFLSPEPLGVTKEEIMCPTGTLGVPEFGTGFTINLVKETKPKTFSELIKISGLSHGTDVWLGNAQKLIENEIVPFKDVIGCRDDIMVYLMYNGLEPIKAFKIMEFVRKGKASKDPETWAKHVETMKEAGIEEWFIDSCAKIKYMFPKAHAAAYVISAFRIAYYKVHNPIVYYATYFSTRFNDFDIDTMIKGYECIKNKMNELINKGYDATNKENSIIETLKLSLEMTARGFRFKPVSLLKSHHSNFIIDEDSKSLIPPFRSIDGLGDVVAKNIVKEREKKPFLSIEDVAVRSKISSTLVDKMKEMGIFEELPESSQLSLF